MKDIKSEIHLLNYWEHFKYAKDISLVYPVGHAKRELIEKAMKDIDIG